MGGPNSYFVARADITKQELRLLHISDQIILIIAVLAWSTVNYRCPPSTKASNSAMNSLLCLCLQDKNWDRQLFVKSCHLNGWRMVNSARSYNIQHPCVDVACRVSSKMTIRLRRGWCDVLWCYLSSVLYSYLRMWRYSNCAICSFILERQRLDVGAEILFIRDTYFKFLSRTFSLTRLQT